MRLLIVGLMLVGLGGVAEATGKTTRVYIDGICYELRTHKALDRFTQYDGLEVRDSEYRFASITKPLFEQVAFREIHLVPCE